jgi:hypothetical protein
MFPEDAAENPFPEPVRVTDVLDLHGFFPEQIPEVVGEFIRNAAELRLKTLRIIHGSGTARTSPGFTTLPPNRADGEPPSWKWGHPIHPPIPLDIGHWFRASG